MHRRPRATLTDSEDEVHFEPRQVRIIAYGASQSSAAAIDSVLLPLEKSGPAGTPHVMPRFGTHVRFKLSTKANRITLAPESNPDDDMPELVNSFSNEGDL